MGSEAINISFNNDAGNVPKPRPQNNNGNNEPDPKKDKNSLPYSHTAINLSNTIVDTPVFHNQSTDDIHSGEILCTLESLTPLLVGNFHNQLKDYSKDITAKLKSLESEKTVIEPIIFNDKVMIPGSSIKGMLRQSLSVLSDSPMERVTEHSYSYRPNSGMQNDSNKYQSYPAVITKRLDDGGFNIDLLEQDKICFVQKKAFNEINKSFDISPGKTISNPHAKNIYIKESLYKTKVLYIPGKSSPLNHKCLSYIGGIDGDGILASAFKQKKTPVYKHIFLKLNAKGNYSTINSLKLDKDIYDFYKKITLNHLFDDSTAGHLSSSHPLSKNLTIKDLKDRKKEICFKENQLIYVEALLDDKNPVKVVSCGHHYLYRWRYRDSVRHRWNIKEQKKQEQVRDILRPLSEETASKEGKPDKLSGARLFFGYAVENDNPSTHGIGVDDYSQLAGRIAINMAVAEEKNNYLLDKQFAEFIPLKQLGEPRPSAVEFYLNQNNVKRDDKAELATYGDLPTNAAEESGELAGRKFYRHQPSVNKNSCLYSDANEIKNANSSLARFVSAPGSKFKFSIRFRSLRDWELGLLLLALNPASFPDQISKKLSTENLKNNQYAHKLGYARPLGFGSVKITANSVEILDNEFSLKPSDEMDAFVTEALKKIDADTLKQWLEIHQYNENDKTIYTYPSVLVKGEPSIFTYHSKIRNQHAKNRRNK